MAFVFGRNGHTRSVVVADPVLYELPLTNPAGGTQTVRFRPERAVPLRATSGRSGRLYPLQKAECLLWLESAR
jgi:hypothetical protein